MWYDVICRPFLELKVKVPYQLVLVNVIDNQFPFKDSKNFSSVGSISPPRVLCSVMPHASCLPPTPQDHLYSLHKNIKRGCPSVVPRQYNKSFHFIVQAMKCCVRLITRLVLPQPHQLSPTPDNFIKRSPWWAVV